MKTLTLSLDAIEWHSALTRRNRSRALKVSIIWPRPGIASREQMREISCAKQTIAFHKADLSERLIFKERVEGPFAVKIDVSETLETHRLEAWMFETLALSINQAVQGATSGIDTRSVRAWIRKFAGNSLDAVEQEAVGLDWIAAGEVEMLTEDVAGWKPVTVRALTAIEGHAVNSKARRGKGAASKRPSEVLLQKGEPAATIKAWLEIA